MASVGNVPIFLLTDWFPSKTMLNSIRHMRLGTCVISGFRREVGEICALLGCYAVCSGKFLPTFRDKILVPSPRVKKSRSQTLNLLQIIYLLNIPWWIITISNFHLLLGSAFCSGHHRTVHLFELKKTHTYFIWRYFNLKVCMVWWWTEQNAEISKHSKLLMMLLHDGIFNKYMNWLAQRGSSIWKGGAV